MAKDILLLRTGFSINNGNISIINKKSGWLSELPWQIFMEDITKKTSKDFLSDHIIVEYLLHIPPHWEQSKDF